MISITALLLLRSRGTRHGDTGIGRSRASTSTVRRSINSPLQARLRITLPSIRIGIFSAAIFSFLASWDEVVVAIFMASPTLQTLPVKIWGSLRADLSPVVAAASSLLVGLTLCLMIVTALLRRKLSR